MKERRPLIVALAVLAVLAVMPVLLGVQQRRALERYRHALRLNGQLKSLAEAAPGPPTSLRNGAPSFAGLMGKLPKMPAALRNSAVPRLPPGSWPAAWMEPPPASDNLTNLWPALRVFMATNAPTLAALRQLCEEPVFEFPIQYAAGGKLMLKELHLVRQLIETLSADARLQLHDGHPDLALAEVRSGVQFLARWNHEPLLISQLTRIAMSGLLVSSTAELLQVRGWTEAELAALQAAWQELDLPALADQTLAVECLMEQDILVEFTRDDFMDNLDMAARFNFLYIVERHWNDPDRGFDAFTDSYLRWWAFQLWRRPQVALANLQQAQAVREACRAAAATGAWARPARQATAASAEREATLPTLPAFIHYRATNYAALPGQYASIQTQRNLVIAALALERFRLQHGQYPARLEQLAPEFLPAVPRDPMDGQPLRYRRNADGTFALYSVGEDARDNGGNPGADGSPAWWQRGPDVVWPQPVSSADGEAADQPLGQPTPPRASPELTGQDRPRFFRRHGSPFPGLPGVTVTN